MTRGKETIHVLGRETNVDEKDITENAAHLASILRKGDVLGRHVTNANMPTGDTNVLSRAIENAHHLETHRIFINSVNDQIIEYS